MALLISFVLKNFAFTMTIVALLLSLIRIADSKVRSKSDIFLGYLFFFAVGLSGIWGFIFHAFFPDMAATFIGWQNSPFQFEVAVANLGMGVVGIFGLSPNKPYPISCLLFTTCFLWGAAFGHVVQMLKSSNFASGNAGLIFYNDLLLPVLLIVFLLQNHDKSDSVANSFKNVKP